MHEPESLLTMSPEPGDVIAGRFVVDEVLGRGAMGVVVAARSITLKRRVAIKLVRCGLDGYARFEREAVALASLESDHVVRVLEYGTAEDGAPYLVMEYLVGRDLRDELAARTRLPVDEAVDCILEACVGLREAHARGIVHRDIKPGNLFLAEREGEPRRVKILDFGISKFLHGGDADASPTESAVVGSPAYMSPEQIRLARSVDARADLWSLGVLLHRLVTGKQPFVGDGFREICAAVATEAPPPLRRDCPEAPIGLERVVLRCLEKELSHRFADVEELAAALVPFASARGRSAEAKVSKRDSMLTSIAPTSRPIPAPPSSEEPSPATEALVASGPRSGLRAGGWRAFGVAVAASAIAATVAFVARHGGPTSARGTGDLAVSGGPASAPPPPPVEMRAVVPVPSAVVPAASALVAPIASAAPAVPAPPSSSRPHPRRDRHSPTPATSASSSVAASDLVPSPSAPPAASFDGNPLKARE
jgi:serine/threonine-protein kinase